VTEGMVTTMQAGPGRPPLAVRLARALGLDRNPLRRASDRAEAWIRAGLVVAFLIGAPIAAVAVGLWTAHAADAGTNARPHAVHAVLIQPATAPKGRAMAVHSTRVLVRATWKNSDNSTRTGEVPAPPGSAAGAAVTVWLDTAGHVTGPPPNDSPTGPVVTAIMALATMTLALLIALRLIRQFLDWRRLADWEAAWRAIGPRWTGYKL
jgi:hypothetical protein